MVPRTFQELSRLRAERACRLADTVAEAREPLLFLAQVADFQGNLPDQLTWEQLSDYRAAVVELIVDHAPAPLKAIVTGMKHEAFQATLEAYWRRQLPSGPETLPARILLMALSNSEQAPPCATTDPQPRGQTCPRCGHPPQAGLLRSVGHGHALSLVCSLCLREWDGRRGVCSACGRGQQARTLSHYASDTLPGRSLQVCSGCRTYVHILEPEQMPGLQADVDEMAGLVLDLWAAREGFQKQQPNLAGI